jgi:hypothetical protein
MNKYKVCVVFPLYYELEAENEEQAEEKALSMADNMLECSSVTPILDNIETPLKEI